MNHVSNSSCIRSCLVVTYLDHELHFTIFHNVILLNVLWTYWFDLRIRFELKILGFMPDQYFIGLTVMT